MSEGEGGRVRGRGDKGEEPMYNFHWNCLLFETCCTRQLGFLQFQGYEIYGTRVKLQYGWLKWGSDHCLGL